MSFVTKFTNSWQLFRRSLEVIGRNKTLLLFPLVSFACALVMTVFFLAPALLYPSGHALSDWKHWETIAAQFGVNLSEAGGQQASPSLLAYAYIVLLYLASMFVATFCNTAFYHQIMEALAGREVSIGGGFRFAGSRVRSILMWSLLAGSIGLLIKLLEERLGWIGRWVMKLVGVAWSVAAVFAIPVIVREGNPNPFGLLRSSVATLRKTWGESLIGYVGLSMGSGIIMLASLVAFAVVVALVLVLHLTPVLIAAAFVIWLLAMLAISYTIGVAGHVFRCALYLYASDGVAPAPYTPDMLNAAWKVKKA